MLAAAPAAQGRAAGADAPAPGGSLLLAALSARGGLPGARPLRIVHLGDSHVASRAFPGAIRELLEPLFGAGTAGLLVPGASGQGSPGGPRLEWDRGWDIRSAPAAAAAAGTGLTGSILEGSARSGRVRVRGSFAAARVVFLRGPGRGGVTVRLDGRPVAFLSLEAPRVEAVAASCRAIGPGPHLLEVEPGPGGPVALTEVSVDPERAGLVYSPLGVVGAQAGLLLRCREDLFVRHLAIEAPDLVIVSFGTNEARSRSFDPASYEGEFRELLRRIRLSAPGCGLLVTAPPDQAERASGGWRPVAARSAVASAQRRAAEAEGATYVDLARAMGGAGAAERWAESSPPLAQPDRVHFTPSGYSLLAREVASAIVGLVEREREAAPPSEIPERLRAEASRPFRLPEERPSLAQRRGNGASRRLVPPRPEGAGGSVAAWRDASGRLVLSNTGPVPCGTPVLGRRGESAQ